MSKYSPLWNWIAENGRGSFCLSFDEIEGILGFPIDHSFLTYKKELPTFGWKVGRISMKEKQVTFAPVEEKAE